MVMRIAGVVLSLTLYFALSALSKLSYAFPGAMPQAFICRAVGAQSRAFISRAVGAGSQAFISRAVGAGSRV